jgi:drug/metabolite transporter (DMT)-like permease
MKEMKAVLLVTLCSVILVGGQVLIKYGLQKDNGLWNNNLSILSNFMLWSQNLYLIVGLVVSSVASIFFIYLIGKYELSYIYPLTASTYIFAFIAGVFFFQEQATLAKVAGLVIITIGIVMVSI